MVERKRKVWTRLILNQRSPNNILESEVRKFTGHYFSFCEHLQKLWNSTGYWIVNSVRASPLLKKGKGEFSQNTNSSYCRNFFLELARLNILYRRIVVF